MVLGLEVGKREEKKYIEGVRFVFFSFPIPFHLLSFLFNKEKIDIVNSSLTIINFNSSLGTAYFRIMIRQIHPIFKKTISMQPLSNQSFDSIRFLRCYMQPISSRKYNCMLILHQISEGAHYVERKEVEPCLDHVNIFSSFIKNHFCIN